MLGTFAASKRTSPKERISTDARLGVGIFHRLNGSFLVTGVNRAFRYEKARELFPWVKSLPRAPVQFISIAEILGALGLILPAATGIYAWLTPVAAVALALFMFMESCFTPCGARRRKPLRTWFFCSC